MDKDHKKKRLRGYAKTTILSFQHMFAMLGATVLVPMLAGLSISITLITAGIGTIIFHFVTKRKVPVFLGSSFAYLPALMTIMAGSGAVGSLAWQQNMGKLVIAIFFTGVAYLLFALIIRLIGVEKVRKMFPPRVVGPVIIVLGMLLVPSIFWNNIIAPYALYGGGGVERVDNSINYISEHYCHQCFC
ncbi:MAG: solute carrier family 23 protein [Bacilli bacterium]